MLTGAQFHTICMLQGLAFQLKLCQLMQSSCRQEKSHSTCIQWVKQANKHYFAVSELSAEGWNTGALGHMNFYTSIYDFLFQVMLTVVRRIKKMINTAFKKAIIKVFFSFPNQFHFIAKLIKQ